MKRSPGSTDGFTSRFHMKRTMPDTIETVQLSAKTYSVPAAAITRPATSGPMTREVFTATAFSASASPSCERGTSSGRIAA